MSRKTVRTPVVEFARKGSTAPAPDGDVVRRKGVIFRAGVYPSQSYAMTPEELRDLARDFAPVPIDAGHPSSESPIDGMLGQLEAVDLSEDGTTLYGTVAFPKWLDEKLGDARRSVSASFHRATKRLKSLSLVTRPQIEDAELLAAFCACHPEAAPAAFTTPTTERRPMPTKKELALAKLQEMDEAENEGVFDALLDDSPADDEPEPSDAGPTPAEFALQQRIATLEAENKAARLANFAAKAEHFADAQVAANRLVTAEKPRVVELHTQAAIDDHDHPAEFGASKQRSRVAAFEATITGRVPHKWTEEQVASFSRTLSNGAEAPDDEAAKQRRIRERLKNTSTGRGVLASRNGDGRV